MYAASNTERAYTQRGKATHAGHSHSPSGASSSTQSTKRRKRAAQTQEAPAATAGATGVERTHAGDGHSNHKHHSYMPRIDVVSITNHNPTGTSTRKVEPPSTPSGTTTSYLASPTKMTIVCPAFVPSGHTTSTCCVPGGGGAHSSPSVTGLRLGGILNSGVTSHKPGRRLVSQPGSEAAARDVCRRRSTVKAKLQRQ
jgi:hypothetical protein